MKNNIPQRYIFLLARWPSSFSLWFYHNSHMVVLRSSMTQLKYRNSADLSFLVFLLRPIARRGELTHYSYMCDPVLPVMILFILFSNQIILSEIVRRCHVDKLLLLLLLLREKRYIFVQMFSKKISIKKKKKVLK